MTIITHLAAFFLGLIVMTMAVANRISDLRDVIGKQGQEIRRLTEGRAGGSERH